MAAVRRRRGSARLGAAAGRKERAARPGLGRGPPPTRRHGNARPSPGPGSRLRSPSGPDGSAAARRRGPAPRSRRTRPRPAHTRAPARCHPRSPVPGARPDGGGVRDALLEKYKVVPETRYRASPRPAAGPGPAQARPRPSGPAQPRRPGPSRPSGPAPRRAPPQSIVVAWKSSTRSLYSGSMRSEGFSPASVVASRLAPREMRYLQETGS